MRSTVDSGKDPVLVRGEVDRPTGERYRGPTTIAEVLREVEQGWWSEVMDSAK